MGCYMNFALPLKQKTKAVKPQWSPPPMKQHKGFLRFPIGCPFHKISGKLHHFYTKITPSWL